MPANKSKPKSTTSRKVATAAAASPLPRPLPLLSFPREIREQIYGHALCETPCRNVQLLRTCKQIAMEAQTYLFRRPLVFGSQSHLAAWLEEVDPRQLRHVSSLRIKIDNPVSHEALERLVLRETGAGSRGPLAQLFDEESEKITMALSQMPNIRDLTLLRGRRDSPYCIWQNMYLSFASGLDERYPHLRSLAFHVHKVTLKPLAGLKSLRSLRFTGLSTSTPRETLAALGKLPHLEEIMVVGIPHRLDAEPYGPQIVKSLTPEVLRGLRPLKNFQVCETYTPYLQEDSMFVTAAMLSALRATHARSLRSLSLSTCIALTSASAEQLETLLGESSLHIVRLCSSPLDPSLVDALPSTTQNLQLGLDKSVTPDIARKVLTTLRVLAHDEQLEHVDWAVRSPYTMPGTPPCVHGKMRVNLVLDAAPLGCRVTSRNWHPLVFDDEEMDQRFDLVQEVPIKR